MISDDDIKDARERSVRIREWGWTNTADLIDALLAERERLTAENEAIRELMNCYNLGGWTDSLALIKERDALRTDFKREQLRLQACGEVALADTPESSADARNRFADYWSGSLDVVIRRVDECMALRADAERMIALLPGPYYMDPPDGGDVPVIEQFRRMAADAERYRWLRDTPIWPNSILPRIIDLWDAAIDAARKEQA